MRKGATEIDDGEKHEEAANWNRWICGRFISFLLLRPETEQQQHLWLLFSHILRVKDFISGKKG